MSADNSGGEDSKTATIAFVISLILSFKASFVSSWVISMVFGNPVTKSAAFYF